MKMKGHWTRHVPTKPGWYWIVPDPAIARGLVVPIYVDRDHGPAGKAIYWTAPIVPPTEDA